LHNTQEIKTIDFDDLDFLSQDNIKKKKNDLDIFFLCKSTSPHYHSSFYRVLFSLVVRHFCVSVFLNSFIITCIVRHFNCPESKIRGHYKLSTCRPMGFLGPIQNIQDNIIKLTYSHSNSNDYVIKRTRKSIKNWFLNRG
jgi:hypothetical protein